jgi:uncharacterized protein
MAGASLFTLLDDIATLLDDVAVLTKLAAKKTAGVLGDDLALNAQQVTGMSAARELPVVWAVAKGSLVNKAILVPAALAISALEVWLRGRGITIPIIVTLMLIGGAFLCYEGVEKVVHHLFHKGSEDDLARRDARLQALADDSVDLVAMEKEKVTGAIRTDFILSAEVIVLTLGVVAAASLGQQVVTLIAIALGMTVVVYGLVAGIVKLDDLGVWLSRKDGVLAALGRGLLVATPWFMKTLSVVGTLAMFLVGGGIVIHNIPAVHHLVAGLLPAQGLGNSVGNLLASLVVGLVLGSVVLAVVSTIKRVRGRPAH